MNLGSSIRSLRKRRGLTLLQLAIEVESDVGNLSRIERGNQWPSEQLLAKIAGVLKAELHLASNDDGDGSTRIHAMREAKNAYTVGVSLKLRQISEAELARLDAEDVGRVEHYIRFLLAERKAQGPTANRKKKSAGN